jgi:hypothetical protein
VNQSYVRLHGTFILLGPDWPLDDDPEETMNSDRELQRNLLDELKARA